MKTLYYITASSVFKVDEVDGLSPINENLVGETLNDALYNKKYVLLTDSQADFYRQTPTATVQQIWDMNVPTVTFEQAKRIKLNELREFDTKPEGEVNVFYINGCPMWLDRDTRVALRNRIDVEEALGNQTTTLWVKGMRLDLPIPMARQIILTLEGYSIKAFDKTAEHEATIEAFKEESMTVQDVLDYNFRKFQPEYSDGYPEKVRLTLGG